MKAYLQMTYRRRLREFKDINRYGIEVDWLFVNEYLQVQ